MSKAIVWVHGDCLSPQNPALLEYPKSPAIWVWDDALIEEWQQGSNSKFKIQNSKNKR
ncbi:MAG TPA: hypothetical protein VK203_26070 [Nostocaceae cyanobacterium]|nr:hypothetical protein [Nostocaceae cyanobacterium]